MKSEDILIKLRQDAEAMLREVPEGMRISVKKEDLDKLIFDTVTIDEEQGIILKIPVWTGPFLAKLDLSELDFEDVSWSIGGKPNAEEKEEIIRAIDATKHGDGGRFGAYIDTKFGERCIPKDFSNTNAVIDFSKSFEAKQFGIILIDNANLSNVDLSNNSFEIDYLNIENTDLSNTNANFKNAKEFLIIKSNLENVDLSYLTLKATAFAGDLCLASMETIDYDKNEQYKFEIDLDDPKTNLCNTGLNVIYDENFEIDYSEMQKVTNVDEKECMLRQYTTYYDLITKSGILDGCKLNGMTIISGDPINPDEVLNAMREQINRIK